MGKLCTSLIIIEFPFSNACVGDNMTSTAVQ